MTDEPINLHMIPVQVPTVVRAHRPDTAVLNVGPPPGISDAECGTVQALVGQFSGLTGYADYWQPTDDQLRLLNAGGVIELVQFAPRMVMHSMSVWPAAAEATVDEQVEQFAETLAGTPIQGLVSAAAAVVDNYRSASWLARSELVDQLQDALAAYIRSEPS
jgi:hypothetical protein